MSALLPFLQTIEKKMPKHNESLRAGVSAGTDAWSTADTRVQVYQFTDLDFNVPFLRFPLKILSYYFFIKRKYNAAISHFWRGP